MKNLADFIRALASLKIETLMGSFYPKQKMYEPKIYRGVIYHGNEEWWHEQFWDDELEEFWPEFPKISKICTLKNGTISKTFHTYSTESLFLRYKKICKKAVKLGSFLQCLVHIFLGHNGFLWKLNLRILRKHETMLAHSRMAILLPLIWQGTLYTWTPIWKKSLLICVESYQSIPYSHTGRVDRGWCTIC